MRPRQGHPALSLERCCGWCLNLSAAQAPPARADGPSSAAIQLVLPRAGVLRQHQLPLALNAPRRSRPHHARTRVERRWEHCQGTAAQACGVEPCPRCRPHLHLGGWGPQPGPFGCTAANP